MHNAMAHHPLTNTNSPSFTVQQDMTKVNCRAPAEFNRSTQTGAIGMEESQYITNNSQHIVPTPRLTITNTKLDGLSFLALLFYF